MNDPRDHIGNGLWNIPALFKTSDGLTKQGSLFIWLKPVFE